MSNQRDRARQVAESILVRFAGAPFTRETVRAALGLAYAQGALDTAAERLDSLQRSAEVAGVDHAGMTAEFPIPRSAA